MRVITGSARGRVLKTVEGMDVRPTADKVKESVFSAVQFEVEGARMLDLFCGSGQMGIEALSRGASGCVFVDSDRRSVEVTRQNLTAAGLFSKARVCQMDALAYLKTTSDFFDLAFLDPPYSTGLLQEALPLAADRMSEGGVILAEHEARDPLPEEAGDFCRFREYRHGRVMITLYRRKTTEHPD